MNRRKAFTLVELLVVIGIIALLVSILLPTLSKARKSAQTVKCLSNLRQMGLAFSMYENEHKQWLPYPTTTLGEPTLWFNCVDPYLKASVDTRTGGGPGVAGEERSAQPVRRGARAARVAKDKHQDAGAASGPRAAQAGGAEVGRGGRAPVDHAAEGAAEAADQVDMAGAI